MYVKKLPDVRERTTQMNRENHTWSSHFSTFDVKKFKLTYLRIRDYEKRDPVKSQHQSPHMWQAILNQIASINSPGDYNLLNDPRRDQQKNHPAEPTPA